MTKDLDTPFEVLHLMAAVTVNLNRISTECGLDVEQLYMLAYVKAAGADYKGRRSFPRTEMTDIMKGLFRCEASQVSKWVGPLRENGLLVETPVPQEDFISLFKRDKGQRAVLTLTQDGKDRLEMFVSKLELFRDDVLVKHPEIYLPKPNGLVAGAVRTFKPLVLLAIKRRKKKLQQQSSG